MLDRLLRPGRAFFALILAASALALAGALAGEHVFGILPCVLCLYQRVPFVLGGLVAAAMLGLPTTPRLRRLGVALILVAFAANTAIAAYHIGVEQHWWASAVCEATADGARLVTGADLMTALTTPQRPACDQVSWTLFGISLAGYNFAFSLGLAVIAAVTLVRARRNP